MQVELQTLEWVKEVQCGQRVSREGRRDHKDCWEQIKQFRVLPKASGKPLVGFHHESYLGPLSLILLIISLLFIDLVISWFQYL